MAALGRAGCGSPGGQAPRPRCPRGVPRTLALCCAPVPYPWALGGGGGAPCRIPPLVAQRHSRGVSPRQPWCGCGRLAEAAHGGQGGGGGGRRPRSGPGSASSAPPATPARCAGLVSSLVQHAVAFSEMFCSRYKRDISSGPSLPSVPTSNGAPGAPPSSPCPPCHLASTTCGHVTLAESVLLGVLSATAPAPSLLSHVARPSLEGPSVARWVHRFSSECRHLPRTRCVPRPPCRGDADLALAEWCARDALVNVSGPGGVCSSSAGGSGSPSRVPA